MDIKSAQALLEHKYKILVTLAILAGLPLWLQALFDIVGRGPVVPVWLMVVCALLVQIACAPLYADLFLVGRGRVPTSDGLIAFSSIACWLLSMLLWTEDGGAAGAAFAGYGALLVAGGLGGALIREQETRDGRNVALENTLNLPTRARVLRGPDETEDVGVADIRTGNVVIVKPGDRAPVDGVVVSGAAEFSSNWLLGNPIPTPRGPGDIVLAGEECFGSVVRVEARRPGSETMMWQSLHVFQEGIERMPGLAAADRLSRLFLPAGMMGAFAVFGFWVAMNDISTAITSALALMALSAPAALGLAGSLPLLAAGRELREFGAKLVEVNAPERAARVQNMVIGVRDFLILRQPQVENIVSAAASEQEIVASARGLLEAVGHPVAPRLSLMAEQEGLEPQQFTNCNYESDRGISGDFGGATLLLGNPSLLSRHGVSYRQMDAEADALEAEGKAVWWLAEASGEKRVLGLLALSPGIRRVCHDGLAMLSAAGIRSIVYLLPGLAPRVQAALRDLPIDDLAQVGGPAALARRVEEMAAGGQVAVASSSLMDLPAVSRSDLRFAEAGATGFELLRPSVIVPTGDLRAVAASLVALRQAGRGNRQNAFLGFSLSVIGMVLAGTGLLAPPIASGIGLGGLLLIASNAAAAARRARSK